MIIHDWLYKNKLMSFNFKKNVWLIKWDTFKINPRPKSYRVQIPSDQNPPSQVRESLTD